MVVTSCAEHGFSHWVLLNGGQLPHPSGAVHGLIGFGGGGSGGSGGSGGGGVGGGGVDLPVQRMTDILSQELGGR